MRKKVLTAIAPHGSAWELFGVLLLPRASLCNIINMCFRVEVASGASWDSCRYHRLREQRDVAQHGTDDVSQKNS